MKATSQKARAEASRPQPVAQPAPETVPMTLGSDRASRVDVPPGSVEQFKALGWVEAKD